MEQLLSTSTEPKNEAFKREETTLLAKRKIETNDTINLEMISYMEQASKSEKEKAFEYVADKIAKELNELKSRKKVKRHAHHDTSKNISKQIQADGILQDYEKLKGTLQTGTFGDQYRELFLKHWRFYMANRTQDQASNEARMDRDYRYYQSYVNEILKVAYSLVPLDHGKPEMVTAMKNCIKCLKETKDRVDKLKLMKKDQKEQLDSITTSIDMGINHCEIALDLTKQRHNISNPSETNFQRSHSSLPTLSDGTVFKKIM